jgi:hypothetical protein
MTLMVKNPLVSLSFDLRREAVFEGCERCLNGKITFMFTWVESPVADNAPRVCHGSVAHCSLVISASKVRGSDSTPASSITHREFDIVLGPRGDQAERPSTEHADGQVVRMPLRQTY